MTKFVDALAQSRWVNKCMFGITAGSLFVAFYAMTGWRNAPTDMTMHVPPSLVNGAQVNVGRNEVPDPNVYLFAFYIWQQVNRWTENGKTDYGNQIFKLQAFFTPACREQLINDQKSRDGKGELDQRTRSISEIPGLGFSEGRVKKLSDGSWNVYMDALVQETSRGVTVKDVYIRYPIHVVRFDIDRERNPWQLGIDCYVPGTPPERLDPKAVEVAITNSGGLVTNSEAYAQKSIGAGVDRVARPSAAVKVPTDTPDPAGPLPALAPATLPAAKSSDQGKRNE